MPLRIKRSPQPIQEEPGLFRRILAAGTRGLPALYPFGGVIGGGLSGAGEAAAQMIEEGSLEAPFTPRGGVRIGVETGLGAIPFYKIFKAGRPLVSAARGALFGSAGEAGRELARGEDLDPYSIAGSGAVGGAITGGLAKLLGRTKVPPPKPEEFIVEPTAQRGGEVLTGGKITPGTTKRGAVLRGAKRAPVSGPRVITAEGKPITVRPEPEVGAVEKGVPYTATAPLTKGAIKAEEVARRKATKEVIVDQQQWKKLQTFLAGKERAAEKAAKEAAKVIENQAKADQIAQTIEEKGLVRGAPRVSESISAVGPEGERISRAIPYRKPRGEGEEGLEGLLGIAPKISPIAKYAYHDPITKKPYFNVDLPEGGATTLSIDELVSRGITPPEIPPFDEAAIRAARDAAQARITEPPPLPESELDDLVTRTLQEDRIAESNAALEARRGMRVVPEVPLTQEPELYQIAKTPIDVLGQAQRAARVEEGINPLAKSQLGISLQAEANRLGLPTKGKATYETLKKFFEKDIGPELSERLGTKAPVPEAPLPPKPVAPTIAPITPEAPITKPTISRPMTPEEVQKELNWIERLKRLGGESPEGLGGEKGAIAPALLARLGLGATGAAIGAAEDPFENRLLSALAGGAAGAALPSAILALGKLGVPKEALQNINISSPEGIKETASRIWQLLPQIQRFNYLTSAWGLPANVLAGPYGSAVMGALEKGLSGDPRGWTALKSLSPQAFARELKGAFPEAVMSIGRAEGRPLGRATTITEKALALPGTYMTTGDVAARRLLEKAGFSVDEARTITLTSEPSTRLGRQLVNVGRGSPLGELLFPFRRTPVNIVEQGAQRLPGLGFFVNPETNPELWPQLVKQGLGAAEIGAGYLAGSNLDPETAKIVRRYVSNLGGQYSLPVSLGFAAGQGARRGVPPLESAVEQLEYTLPLPTTDPLVELGRFAAGALPGGRPIERLPRGAVPAFIREAGASPPGPIGEWLRSGSNPPGLPSRRLRIRRSQ